MFKRDILVFLKIAHRWILQGNTNHPAVKLVVADLDRTLFEATLVHDWYTICSIDASGGSNARRRISWQGGWLGDQRSRCLGDYGLALGALELPSWVIRLELEASLMTSWRPCRSAARRLA